MKKAYASIRRTVLTIALLALLGGILGCDRFEDLVLPNVVGPTGEPISLVVTTGAITLSRVTQGRIEGIFNVNAQSRAILHTLNEDDQVTITGSFSAIQKLR